MIQQFIELGEGYGDIYELCELMKTNKHRISRTFIFTATDGDKKVASIVAAFEPVGDSKFTPIYICREGIPYSTEKPSKRLEIFEETVKEVDQLLITLDVKHSSIYAEKELYYQYLIGILRLYHYIPSLH
ncbi:MAG TPA: methylthioribose kinase [Rummeliibacillus sp.]|nr:methylthioribose kinase [Rummeliibacillus sp.]